MAWLRAFLMTLLFGAVTCLAQVVPVDASRQARVVLNGGPEFPRASLRYEEEGDVVLRLAVTSAGSVEILGVEQSSGFGRLDLAAAAYARTLKAEPARDSVGTVVASQVNLPISFRIEGSPIRKPNEFGTIGVRVDQLPVESAAAFSLPETAVVIRELRAEGPGARARLEVADIVLAANEWPVSSPMGLIQAIQATRPGGKIVLTVFRRSKTFQVAIPVDLLVR